MAVLVLSAVFLILIIPTIVIYNKLVRMKNMMREGWSGIDVQLKKRYDLIPNIVDIVKGYTKYESEVFERVVAMRNKGINAKTVKAREQAENNINQALGGLFVVVENYPQLKANTQFLELQLQLSEVENHIQMARRYYNGTVRENNILIESFPSNVVAGLFSFKKGEYFELENSHEGATPKIQF